MLKLENKSIKLRQNIADEDIWYVILHKNFKWKQTLFDIKNNKKTGKLICDKIFYIFDFEKLDKPIITGKLTR